ncbi:spore germination protein [Aureibacillus halotolerans]|uniref:Spore germination protein KA n=1 Tax=Aureibacillus halotolerans TaxID=1508390 RepID=A0A4R6U663_9BACI|nr:spore germination protein [Aureibacillus halotolerans]TDQ41988.1 spore germination protein KA [Aureibacillus halotolerans]
MSEVHSGAEKTIAALRALCRNSSDVVFRQLLLQNGQLIHMTYLADVVDTTQLAEEVIHPLRMLPDRTEWLTIDTITFAVDSPHVTELKSFKQLTEALFSGSAILVFDGAVNGVSVGMNRPQTRSPEEPIAESTVRGSRAGFIENIGKNVAFVRNILQTSAFKTKMLKIGKHTQTKVSVGYIEGVAADTLVQEVEKRLRLVKIAGVIETGDLEEHIEDNPYSIFPQMIATERADVVASSLMEGKVAIFVDNTPFVLVLPGTFISLIQSPDDYYQRFYAGSFIRLIRFIFIFLALTLPGIYVAFVTFHQELVPSQLLLTIAISRETIPFPTIIELLIMDLTFEGLREAGLRLPKQIGAAVSIVGALVIGEAAVNAGLVSRPMVVVVALTGIASFIMPRFNLSTPFRLLRFPLAILAACFGFIGLLMGLLLILTHMCSLRSFGVPYMEPLAPFFRSRLKDTLVRKKEEENPT